LNGLQSRMPLTVTSTIQDVTAGTS
jgi:hypothetical protein